MKENDYANVESSEDWLSKEGGYPTMDYDITQPIDFSLGVGAKHNDGGVTVRDDKYSKTVILKINSFIGQSAGARHVYGVLLVPSTSMVFNDGTKGSRCGYGTPNYISGWKIHITKELNQLALDLDEQGHPADKCFEDMELGEETTRWERTEEDELIAKGKLVFDTWFTGDWKFKIEDD